MTAIDVVRGRLDTATRAALEAHGAPVDDVVCVVRDAAGQPVGASVVRDTPFPGVADRRLWTLELLGAAGERFRDVHAATWRALDADYAGTGPEGLLAIPADADPALEWSDPRTLFAGFTEHGREARIAPFTAARTTPLPGWPPADPSYRVLPYAEQDVVTADDVVALWLREGILNEAEARRRVEEVLLVAVDHDGGLVGVSTSYLQRNAQLRLDLHHVRAFVAAAHRRSTAATALAVGAREHLAGGLRERAGHARPRHPLRGREPRAQAGVPRRRLERGGRRLHRRERARRPRARALLQRRFPNLTRAFLLARVSTLFPR